MVLATKPDPESAVLCHFCGWCGRVKDCNPRLDCLVLCPKCGETVKKVVAEDGGFIVPSCLVPSLVDLLTQPPYIVTLLPISIETGGEE
jgi:hypothetical protein